MRKLMPVIKERMWQPKIHRQGEVTLTYSETGFVLEDAGNPLNVTLHTGSPFKVAKIQDEDLLDLIGLVKLLLRIMAASDTRDAAVLAHYANRPAFVYQARFSGGKRTELSAEGQFVVSEAPSFFKLRMDSDLATPYGAPMQGNLIYLRQRAQPGVLINTMGLLPK
jgi:hypothetical protein